MPFAEFVPGPLSPLWNSLLAGLAGLIVWYAGVRLARCADGISNRLGGQQALIGTLLLGGIVSLPEMATSIGASAIGNAPMAVNTLIGGVAVTMAILAVADAVVGREPLSVDVSHPVVLLQGACVVLVLAATAAAITLGDISILGVGAWTSTLFLLYVLSILIVKRYQQRGPWVPRRAVRSHDGHRLPAPSAHQGQASEASEPSQPCEPAGRVGQAAWGALLWRTAMAGLAVLVAGFVLAITGDALAEQTGLGGSFVGLLLGGISTSLPELSTTLAVVRLRQYEMAFGDAFGTNLCSLGLLVFADAAYPGQPVINEAGRFALFAVILALTMTAVYLAGLIARPSHAVLRMGIDSLVVLVLYAGGLVILFYLR